MSTTTAADIEGVLSRRVAKCRPRWPDLYQLEIELTYCGDVERAEEVYDATLEYSGTDEEVLGEWATAARGDFEDLDMRLIAFVHARCLYWHIAQVLHARSPERRAEHLEWFVLPPPLRWGRARLVARRPDAHPLLVRALLLVRAMGAR
jgi:hypothetical protein